MSVFSQFIPKTKGRIKAPSIIKSPFVPRKQDPVISSPSTAPYNPYETEVFHITDYHSQPVGYQREQTAPSFYIDDADDVQSIPGPSSPRLEPLRSPQMKLDIEMPVTESFSDAMPAHLLSDAYGGMMSPGAVQTSFHGPVNGTTHTNGTNYNGEVTTQKVTGSSIGQNSDSQTLQTEDSASVYEDDEEDVSVSDDIVANLEAMDVRCVFFLIGVCTLLLNIAQASAFVNVPPEPEDEEDEDDDELYSQYVCCQIIIHYIVANNIHSKISRP